MNTKQVLYNALQAQLQEKQDAYDKYIKTVFDPAFQKLVDEVEDDLNDTLEYDFKPFTFDGYTLKMKETGYRNVELEVKSTYNSNYTDKKLLLHVDWSIDHNITKADTAELERVFLLGEVISKLDVFEDLFFNNWIPKYDKIIEDKFKINEDLRSFKNAMNSLQCEIRKDAREAMKQVGFEIKKFKPYYHYYISDKKITESEHSIPIQIGRAQYDRTLADGFKVLGKKGNKYKVEVYRGSQVPRTYDILEKKFDSFIEDVHNWEYEEADKKKKQAEERAESYK